MQPSWQLTNVEKRFATDGEASIALNEETIPDIPAQASVIWPNQPIPEDLAVLLQDADRFGGTDMWHMYAALAAWSMLNPQAPDYETYLSEHLLAHLKGYK